MAANTELLEEIHAMLAEQIIHEIKMYRSEDMPIPAADKAVYAKFLRDNSIFCVPKSEDDLMELRNRLMSSDRSRAIDELKRQAFEDLSNDNY